MKKRNFYILINIVTAFAVTMFFSCQPNGNNQQTVQIEDAPIGEGTDVNLKYTDSGRLAAILNSPRILDFTNKSFPYLEFPDGIVLDMIDKDGKVSTVTADYAISYQQTGLIDMRGNIDIQMSDSTRLKAQQLYWDELNSWVFTDQPYKSYFPDGTINEADGFDANQDFTLFNSRVNDGIMYIQE